MNIEISKTNKNCNTFKADIDGKHAMSFGIGL